MQIIKSFLNLTAFLFPLAAICQSTYIMPGSKEYHFIDRLQIKQQTNTDLNFSSLKPLNRKHVVEEILFLDSARLGFRDSLGQDKFKEWTDLRLTRVDEYNLERALMNNAEWVPGGREFPGRNVFLNTFYKTPANFYEVKTKDFFLAINPVLNIRFGKESDNDETLFLNSRGLTVRGMIAERLGFSATVTDNQERGPSYFNEYVSANRAVPGNGFYKDFKKTAVDYFDARGYITFKAAKYINFQAGYDKNFIGNGYRSLFLSDWGNSNLFVKVNTRIWKLNYQNLFMELMPQFKKSGDSLLNRKYAAMHHLSMNVTKWLNIGLFEGVIFGRPNRFDFQYLNPLIFYRHIEGTVGSPDNAVAGFDLKANVAHKLQFYGQFLMDEFILSEVKNRPKSWVNKFGIQAGVKYVDAFGIDNLDLQIETNRVRPFTYSHNDTIANYTHYNQPLAHPLGANFQEVIGIMRYQPTRKLYIYGRALFYQKGIDTAGVNFGGNIFRSYLTRSADDGFTVGGGAKAKCLNALLEVSYELKENLFIDMSLQQRTFLVEGILPRQNSTLISGGIRLNFARREYDY